MEKKYLEKLILQDNLSYEKIGRMFDVTGSAIKKRAKRLGIILPHRRYVGEEEMRFLKRDRSEYAICPICGKRFRKKYKSNVCCSRECGISYSIIKRKNKPLKRKVEWDGIEKKDMWKFTRIVNNHGYLYARCPYHPFATSTGYVYLHRLIVENNLGRLLHKDEVIHHKDGNKLNNDINNLVVLTPSEHSKLHSIELTKKGIKRIPKNPAKGKNTKFGRFEEKDIKEIRRLVNEKLMSWNEVAKMFGVTKGAIQQIIKHKTYKWVA